MSLIKSAVIEKAFCRTYLKRLVPFVCAGASLVLLTCNYSFDVVEEKEYDEICDSGIDENGDGLTDCEDPECEGHPACAPVEICDSGLDDDENGLTDCEDPECAEEWFCNEPQPCNEDGICNTFEDPFWCNDCCPDASLVEGDIYDYIFTEITVPSTYEEAEMYGVDLDGDGIIDNALANLFVLFPTGTGEGLNVDLQTAIDDGEFITLSRLYVSSWPSDDAVAAQIFQGTSTYDATEDNLTGEGESFIDPSSERSAFLQGELEENSLDTCPGTIKFPFFLGEIVLYMPIKKARLVSTGAVTDYEWEEMMLGGGLSQQTMDENVLPTMLIYLNQRAIYEPESSAANFAHTFVDGKCSSEIPGCEDVVNGEGDCSVWDGDITEPPLTFTEIKCNSVIQNMLTPDIDSNGDGEYDLLSVGFRIRAIRVTIMN